jgi:hypothetical protein
MLLVCLGLIALLLAAGAAAGAAGAADTGGPVAVEIRKDKDGFRLYRGGRPYFVKGAVYWSDPTGRFPLSEIAAAGGNSVRCGGGGVKRIMDEADRQGITVLLGLPVKMESVHKFDYDDAAAVRAQFDAIKAIVLASKDHPALLMWGIGNELSEGYKNRKVWDAVNDVARMIHEVDGKHPCMTVIGDGSIHAGDIREIIKRCPDLDLLGVNFYQGIEAVPAKVRQDGWAKPYVITEWGPSGDWQVQRTKWGASIEDTSTQKAEHYAERYRAVMGKDTELCVGSYAFMWDARFERTHTWYGMFVESGQRTEAVNAMQFLWTGKWPAHRAARIEPMTIDGHAAADSVQLAPGGTHVAAVKAVSPAGDRLTWTWEVLAEVARGGYAGMGEKRSKPMAELIQQTRDGEITFAAPAAEGAYRVFVVVCDEHRNAATANIPFSVKAPGP